jgi:hypothetical protein
MGYPPYQLVEMDVFDQEFDEIELQAAPYQYIQ